MAHVELTLSPLPAHVRTVRLVAVAAARRAGLEAGLVDELRLALGEACSRAVALHARHAPDVPVSVLVTDGPDGLTVEVRDRGPAAGPLSGNLAEEMLDNADEPDGLVDPDVALAVLSGLVDDCDIAVRPDGTTVTMRWPLPPPVLGLAGPGSTAVAQA
jgi:serine/threonine-protein kinase RsbW